MRLSRANLSWEPWLHSGIWIATIATLIFGDQGVVPPINGEDWVWVFFGLTCPVIAFFSASAIKRKPGRIRYLAIWTRTMADIGLVTGILAYLLARLNVGLLGVSHIFGDVILLLCAWFTSVLIYRDIKFLIATEKLASFIHQGLCGKISFEEILERNDNAG